MQRKAFFPGRGAAERILCLALTLVLCLGLALTASADAELPAESPLPEEGLPCFSREELEDRTGLEGVFFTALPDPETALVLLGSRSLRPGDAVSRADLSRLRVETLAGRFQEKVEDQD